MQAILKLMGVSAAVLLSTSQTWAYSDNSIGVTWSNHYREPNNPEDVTKTIVTGTHFSTDLYGRNLLVASFYQSDDKDPDKSGEEGAQEFYGFYRRYVSLNSLISESPFKNSMVRDVNLTLRVDAGRKNNLLKNSPLKGRAGLSVDLNVPKGFLEVGTEYVYESNNNELTGGRFGFDPTYAIFSSWGYPLGEKHFVEGFIDFIGAQGKDGFNSNSKPSTMLEMNYFYDVGKPGGLKVGTGYHYWRNKYSFDAKSEPSGGGTESLVHVGARYHF